MLDRGRFWTPAPAVGQARFSAAGVAITAMNGLAQVLVSGKLDFAADPLSLYGAPVGFAGTTTGPAYAVRIARDRALLVSQTAIPLAGGWDAESGIASTPVHDAMLVLDLSGPGLPDLLAKATALPQDDPTPSAAILFAGMPCLAYRFARPETLRLHVERPLAPALAEWLRRA